jgi:hypothetical protein
MGSASRVLFAVLLVQALAAFGQSTDSPREGDEASTPQTQVIGSWRLISVETIRPNGEIITEWMGKNPTGLIVYLPNGLMSVQIMRDPRPARFESGSRLKASPEELKAAYLGYYAYWGKYTISPSDSMITHDVESSLWPEEVGTIYKRFYSIEGSRLVLTTAPYKRGDEERRNRLVWERVP